MNHSPRAAQHGQFGLNKCRDSVDFLNSESQGLAQFGWPVGTMQMENSFAPGPHYVHMGRTVVVGVDSHPVGAESQDRWHDES
jgi:hypothetical protein